MILRIVRPSLEAVAARKREIADRYASAKRKKLGALTMAAIRASEMTRLYKKRYPSGQLPDDEDGEELARLMLQHLNRLRDAPRRMSRWLDRWMTGLDLASHERMISDALTVQLRYRADKLAWKLKVTVAERQALNLRTIGAIDQTREQRARLVQERKRERDRARRRVKGAKPRMQYEQAAISRAKPWEANGISRATWYRRKAVRQV
jgi:hypothetical protein